MLFTEVSVGRTSGHVFPDLFLAIAVHRPEDTLPGLELEGKFHIHEVTAARFEDALMVLNETFFFYYQFYKQNTE